MSRTASLLVRIDGDATGAVRATSQASKSVSGFQGAMAKAAKPAAAVVGGLVAFGTVAVKAASRTEQAMGAVDKVFEGNSATVRAWAANAAQSVGLSSAEYGELASRIGGSLRNAGIPMDQIASKTDQLIRQGADLAATYGGTTADAVSALGSALRGEADPAEKYALALNQTNVQALLAAKGQDKLTGTALTAAKASATLELAAKQGAPALNAFAIEANTAEGQAARMSAAAKNAASDLGTALLPAAAGVAEKLAGVAKWMSQNTGLAQALAGVIGGLAVAVLAVNAAYKAHAAYTAAMATAQAFLRGSTAATAVGYYAIAAAQYVAAGASKVLALATRLLSAAFLSSPWGWIILGIVAVVAAFVLLWQRSETFRAIVMAVFQTVATAAQAAAAWLKSAFSAAWDAIKAAATVVGTAIQSVFTFVATAAQAVGAVLSAIWRAVFGAIVAIVTPVASLVASYFRLWATVAQLVAAIIAAVFRVAFQLIMVGVRLVAALLGVAFRAAGAVVRVVASLIAAAFRAAFGLVSAAARVVGSVIGAAFRVASSVARSVASVIGAVMRAVFSAVGSAARAVGNVISAAFRAVSGPVSAVAGVIRGALGGALTAVGAIARSVGGGISGAFGAVRGVIDSIVGAVRRLIGWISKIKIPSISLPFGLGALPPVGVSVPTGLGAPATFSTGPTLTYLPSGNALASLLGLRGKGSAAPSVTYQITVQGALDPEAVARQIKRLVLASDRRAMGVQVKGNR